MKILKIKKEIDVYTHLFSYLTTFYGNLIAFSDLSSEILIKMPKFLLFNRFLKFNFGYFYKYLFGVLKSIVFDNLPSLKNT